MENRAEPAQLALFCGCATSRSFAREIFPLARLLLPASTSGHIATRPTRRPHEVRIPTPMILPRCTGCSGVSFSRKCDVTKNINESEFFYPKPGKGRRAP
jgi:hypothetical protein